jgi:replicative DNA helicase
MTAIRNLLTSDRGRVPSGWSALTGLTDLDELTGGVQSGALWVVSGTSGVGRSMFLIQLARQAALTARLRTRLVSAREPASYVLHCLLASLGPVALHRLRASRLSEQDQGRLGPARAALAAADLDVDAAVVGSDLPEPESVLAAPEQLDVLLVDDLDLWVPDPVPLLRLLRAYARDTGTAVVVTAPNDVVFDGPGPRSPWVRLPDMLLELHRPDMIERLSPRAGEIDLILHRHRTGPVATVTCAFQGYYARVVDHPSDRR